MRLQNNEEMKQLLTRFEASLSEGISLNLSLKENEDLVDYYDCLRSYDMVIEVLDMAIDQHPYSVHYKLQKAAFLLQLHQAKDALVLIDQAAVLSPGNFEVLVLSIHTLTQLQQLELAAKLLEELPEPIDATQKAAALLAHAIWHEAQFEFERMYYFLRAALDVCPNDPVILEKLSLAVELTKRYDDSIKIHQNIIDRFPYNHQAWYNLGQAAFSIAKYEIAMEAFEYAFIIDPYFELAYREYIDCCIETKQYAKVIRCFEDMGGNFLQDSNDLLRVGQCYMQLGQFDEAEQAFKEAINTDAFEDEAYFYMAECKTLQSDFSGALHYYSRAIQLNDKREDFFAARAEVYLRMGRLMAAESDFIEATRIAPDDGVYWVQYCSFLMQAERAAEALEILEQGVDFEDPEMLYCRIACLFLLGRRKEATYWLVEALAEYYYAHNILFDIIPDLEMDNDISAIIAGHHYP